MLVLQRKTGESLVFMGDITVSVISYGRNQVTLGVSAPPDREQVRRKLCTIGEDVAFPGDILLRVLTIDGNRVKFGITAPKDVSIVREEVILRSGTRL